MISYVLKRILMVLVGYLIAVLVGLIAVAALYAILSSLPDAPAYFELMEFTPVAVLAVPPLGIFVYFLTIILTGMQALVFALIAEFFSLRSFWLHVPFGAAAAAAGFTLIWPDATDDPATLSRHGHHRWRRPRGRPDLLADRRARRRFPPSACLKRSA